MCANLRQQVNGVLNLEDFGRIQRSRIIRQSVIVIVWKAKVDSLNIKVFKLHSTRTIKITMHLNTIRIAGHIYPNIGLAPGISIILYLKFYRQAFILF